MNTKRIRRIGTYTDPIHSGVVIYVMAKDQRVRDNFALIAAQKYAEKHNLPLMVLFVLYPCLGNRTRNQYAFMVEGMRQVERELASYGIPLLLRVGQGSSIIAEVAREVSASALFFDFSPLREARRVVTDVSTALELPIFLVDASNIVPVWQASDKQEFAAYTIRKKIHQQMAAFREPAPPPGRQPDPPGFWKNDWDSALDAVQAPLLDNYEPVIQPGSDAAQAVLDQFIHERLEIYAQKRNDPTVDALSHLSAYLHFGQISSRTAVRAVQEFANRSKRTEVVKGAEAFVEECVVRRELAQNYCWYNPKYDQIEGAPEWARQTLAEHANDPRQYLYSYAQLEQAQTHDDAWNAAQIEMMRSGKMHGYLRMYWAKKILEWSSSPEEAIAHAIRLNDTYELDGFDPNGYTGVMWAIAGVHDRPWTQRSVFGKIRYMNYNGLKRKIPIQKYIDRWLPLRTGQ